jgi:predicted dehydrogenase
MIDRAEDGDHGGPFQTVEVSGAYHYHLMIEHFADAVLNKRPLAYTPQDSLGNMQTIDALKEAAQKGTRVTVGR